MHEFNAGTQLLANCLADTPTVKVEMVLNGRPQNADEKVFDGAQAVVFYMDGGDRHEVVLNAMLWLAKVEVPATGVEFKVTPAQLDEQLDPKPAPRK